MAQPSTSNNWLKLCDMFNPDGRARIMLFNGVDCSIQPRTMQRDFPRELGNNEASGTQRSQLRKKKDAYIDPER